jgi:hypothetical protein
VVDAGGFGALDAAHEFVVAEFQLHPHLLGAEFAHDALGVVHLRVGHGPDAHLIGKLPA